MSDIKTYSTREAWHEFLNQFPSSHLLQTWEWGELKSKFGWRPLRVSIARVGAQILLRRVPLLGYIAYIPKGPVGDVINPESMDTFFTKLQPMMEEERAIFLKIEPDTQEFRLPRGFMPSSQTIQPRQTIIIDLTPLPDEILARMKSKTRYNIGLAERKGITEREGEAKDLAGFYKLMQVTAQRDDFGVHSHTYYETAYELFAAQNLVHLPLAYYEGKLLAGVMVFAWGRRAYYLYGASSDEHRNLMPNYLVQWRAMEWARNRGCTSYDLWGIPDIPISQLEAELTDPQTDLGGVYRFKRGFGGNVVLYAGAYDCVYSQFGYWLYQRFLKVSGRI